jgi:hypothetical protein
MNQKKKESLIKYLKSIVQTATFEKSINSMIEEARSIGRRKDWLWHELIVSISTWGNSERAKNLLENVSMMEQLNYEQLKAKSIQEAEYTINTVIPQAKIGVRNISPERKASILFKNFKLLQDLGGCEKVSIFLLNIQGREAKIRFLTLFHGVSEKYARNIFMDIYHADFINSIAIDDRIGKVLNYLEVNPDLTYIEKESILQEIATICSLNGWALDRYLYNNMNEFMEKNN